MSIEINFHQRNCLLFDETIHSKLKKLPHFMSGFWECIEKLLRLKMENLLVNN